MHPRRFAILGEQVVLENQVISPGCVVVQDDTVVDVLATSCAPPGVPVLGASAVVCPGFVDIHCHGYGGEEEVTLFWRNPAYTLRRAVQTGTTSVLATLLFPHDKHHGGHCAALCETVEKHVGQLGLGAVLEGVHAEGPVLASAGACPAQNADMSLAEFDALLDALPSLRIMTISPALEAPREYERIRRLLERGVVPALGHDTRATAEEIAGALRLATPSRRMHMTHVFNVMTFHHRECGLANFAMLQSFPDVLGLKHSPPCTIELVGDMVHVHPLAVALALQARSPEDVCFVTDAISESTPGKELAYAGRRLEVSTDGARVTLQGDGRLAGSCTSLHATLVHLVRTLRLPLDRAVAAVSANPARVAGLAHVGRIAPGCRADLVLMDADLRVSTVVVAGQVQVGGEQAVS